MRITCANCSLHTPGSVGRAYRHGRVCVPACRRTRCIWGHGRCSIATGHRSSSPASRYPRRARTVQSSAAPSSRRPPLFRASQARLAPAMQESRQPVRAYSFVQSSGTNGSSLCVSIRSGRRLRQDAGTAARNNSYQAQAVITGALGQGDGGGAGRPGRLQSPARLPPPLRAMGRRATSIVFQASRCPAAGNETPGRRCPPAAPAHPLPGHAYMAAPATPAGNRGKIRADARGVSHNAVGRPDPATFSKVEK